MVNPDGITLEQAIRTGLMSSEHVQYPKYSQNIYKLFPVQELPAVYYLPHSSPPFILSGNKSLSHFHRKRQREPTNLGMKGVVLSIS